MKKIIVLLLITFTSFSQVEMGFGVMIPNGSLYLDYTFNKKSGFGFDIPVSTEGISYGTDYTGIISLPNHHYYDPYKGKTNSGWSGMGAYYISPEYKGFSGQIGGGSVSRLLYEQFYDRLHILSPNGNYRIANGKENMRYFSFGLSKSFKLPQEFDFLSIEIKQFNRLYGDGIFEPEIGVSFRLSISGY